MSAPITFELSPEQVELIARCAAGFVEPPPGPEPWLDKRALATALGCSVRWIEARLREGMPSIMLAGSRKFRRFEVEAWLERAGYLHRSG